MCTSDRDDWLWAVGDFLDTLSVATQVVAISPLTILDECCKKLEQLPDYKSLAVSIPELHNSTTSIVSLLHELSNTLARANVDLKVPIKIQRT